MCPVLFGHENGNLIVALANLRKYGKSPKIILNLRAPWVKNP